MGNDNKWKNTAAKINGGYKPVTTIKGLTKQSVRQTSGPKNIGLANITLDQNQYTYGEQINPNPTVTFDGNQLTLGTDYEITHQEVIANEKSNPDLAGKVVITIKGINNYNGEAKVYANLNKAQWLPNDKIEPVGSYKQSTNTITVSRNDSFDNQIQRYREITLPNGWEFTVPNYYIAPGNSKIIYKGDDAGFYKNNEFNLNVDVRHQKENINGVTFDPINDYEYTGYEQTPTVNLKYNNKPLTFNQDYTVAYDNNVNAGIANIIITGDKYFNNTKIIPFNITKANNQIYSFFIENNHPVTYARFGQDKVQYQYFKDQEATIPLDNAPSVTGTYYVKATIPGTENYNEVSSNVIEFNYEQDYQEKQQDNSNNLTLILAITIPVSLIVLALIIGLTIYFIKKRKVNKA